MKVLRNTLVATLTLTAVTSASAFGTKALKSNEVVKNIVSVENEPTFKRKGDKLLLNLLNLDQDEVIIRVKDSEGRIVYSEVINGELVIEKAFNFEKAIKDDYIVEIIDDNKSFKEKVALR